MKVLIVEDDLALGEQLKQGLSATGADVSLATDGRDGLFQATELPYDVAVVDLGLPQLDGIELIRQLRASGSSLPVLILTARGGWKSKVDGLEAGGDDYMEKPFHIEELQARLRALLRRVSGYSSELVAGPLSLNLNSQQFVLQGQPLELTAFEHRILEYLMRHRNEVVSKTVLTDYLYEQDFDRDSNVIEVLVGRLRRKLAVADGFAPITTLRGRGYRFAD
ncbi:DNA-binding response regulator [Bacterioplanes sanyensis]|uniref:DNA-binding response regulator n=1 Tax=Bacterioplanes sanyensis TaxID=1249553 RepID=A0A222FFS1_9GAMM|nr:response regulator transcription factor [Bacterioplanes sanyensis]ASP37344.1 DNA-binding response regulator [Bacterioplanes sanyensis]